jgi:hypothetical protein
MEDFAKVLVILGGIAFVAWMAHTIGNPIVWKEAKTRPRKEAETAKDLVYEALGESKVLDEMASGLQYIAVTDSKVVLGQQHWRQRRGKKRHVKTYALDQIISVDVQQHLMTTDMEIVTAGAIEQGWRDTGVKSRMENENILTWPNSEYSRVQQLAQTILDARAAFIHGQKPSVQPVAESITDQIGKLAELHKQGILSDEEFSEKKTELLKRM